MAWTEQCKIDAVAQVDHLVQRDGISKRKAIRQMSQESGIPAKTLERWYWPSRETDLKNEGTTAKPKTSVRTIAKFKKRKWANATVSLKRINGILEKIVLLEDVPLAVLRSFLKEFCELELYAKAAHKELNNRAKVRDRRAA